MRLLFTADIHNDEIALRNFVNRLDSPLYDCGVIAGDILDDYLSVQEIKRISTEHPESQISGDASHVLLGALLCKEREIKEVLAIVQKPVFILRGNHDRTPWRSEGNVWNLHWRRINFGGYNFVGYEHSEFSRTEEEQERELALLRRVIDRNTILVTHVPAFGILDRLETDSTRSVGSRALRRMVDEVKPLLHLHGHAHGQAGVCGRTVNGAHTENRRFYSIVPKTGRVMALPAFFQKESDLELYRRFL